MKNILQDIPQNMREPTMVGVLRKDLKGRAEIEISWLNPAFSDLTGYELEDLAGQSPMALTGPDTDKRVLANVIAQVSQGQPASAKLTFHKKNGLSFHVEVSVSPFVQEGSDDLHLIFVYQDITANRASQQTPAARPSKIASTHPLRSSIILNGAPGNVKLLVAEDNPMNRRVIQSLLMALEYEFDMVENGKEAVKATRDGSYDLILMDISMPVMSGEMATRVIRAMDERIKGIPIVAVTAHAMKGDRERFITGGFSDYLPKPIDVASLSSMLDKHLSGKRVVA